MGTGTNDSPTQDGSGDFDRLFGGANPNPERVGCPSSDVLSALASKRRGIGDAAYEHLAECSPCYREFRRLQGDIARPSHRKAYVATAAAIVVVTLVGGRYFIPRHEPRPRSADVHTTMPNVPTVRLSTADLRNASPTRGSKPASQVSQVKLSKDLVQLTVLLPIGSEPGRYNVRLLRSSGEVVARAVADASIVNFVITITTTLDLRAVQPAVYNLELRRAGEHADSYPVTVE